MIKRFIIFICFLALTNSVVQASVNKVAVVDVQKVVTKSAQVQALKRDQELKRKDLANLINKANNEINKQTDESKKKALAEKYNKEIATKQESNAKIYAKKLQAADSSINATIAQQAKALGYDIVLTKGSVLYGGDDITEAILKVVK